MFADEAIYIRWAQLIIDDWRQYLFFALNDGKTPLFIWSLIPFQFIFKNQLFAGRFLSVLIGLGQVLAMGWLLKLLKAKNKFIYLGMLLTAVLPFWYFHQRMALMDGMMVLFLSLSIIAVLKLIKSQNNLYILLTGLFFGLALLTKLPAIIFIFILFLFGFWGVSQYALTKINIKNFININLKITLAIFLGLLIFLSLKLHPAFGQLFSRGSDFLYPVGDVLAGKWRETLISVPNYINYFINYLTWPIILLNVLGLFSPKNKKTNHILFWSGILFLIPIAILGKVVYPRYLLPACIFLSLNAVLGLQNFWDYINTKKLKIKLLIKLIFIILLANALALSGSFIYQNLFEPNNIAFVSADKEQYLYKWSSGHGIRETVGLIKNLAQDKKIAVATEGYFGTLPDALLMYFHQKNVNNIYIEGVGYPVKSISEKFINNSQNFDQKLLIVNSHRLEIDLANKYLLAEYCRPDNKPCLQVWDITAYLANL